MDKLFVPVDFSKNSRNALEYAIQIGNLFGSTIHLVHTYKVSNRAGMFISVEQYVLEDVEQEMSLLLKEMEPRLENGASFKPSIVRGDTIPTLTRGVEQIDPDLIIMGTQGASGLKEVFMGSITNGLIKNTNKPMLAIPADYSFTMPESIVLAIDDIDITSQSVIMPLSKLARKFDARIMVFHSEVSDEDAGIDPSIDIFLDGVEHSFHYELKGDAVNKSINDFVSDNRAEMLCMIQRERGFWKGLFHSSATKKEVFDSPVPLLVLHDV
jgi:nucleotide-binding universal stress UspA family protein